MRKATVCPAEQQAGKPRCRVDDRWGHQDFRCRGKPGHSRERTIQRRSTIQADRDAGRSPATLLSRQQSRPASARHKHPLCVPEFRATRHLWNGAAAQVGGCGRHLEAFQQRSSPRVGMVPRCGRGSVSSIHGAPDQWLQSPPRRRHLSFARRWIIMGTDPQ